VRRIRVEPASAVIAIVIIATCVIALAFGFFGSMPLAGPVAALVVSRATRRRYRSAVVLALGAAAAEGIYAGVAFWGFTSLLARHPLVVPISHATAAVVLVGLGLRFSVWKPKQGKESEDPAGALLLGFSMSAFNPTLLLTWGAAVAFLYSKGFGRGSSVDAIAFGVSAAAGVGGWFVLLVTIMHKLEGKLPQEVFTWTIRALGVVLVGLGVWSGVQFVAATQAPRWQSAPIEQKRPVGRRGGTAHLGGRPQR
jgi:threonine/homoserine/homoserine lactone efflux protein